MFWAGKLIRILPRMEIAKYLPEFLDRYFHFWAGIGEGFQPGNFKALPPGSGTR